MKKFTLLIVLASFFNVAYANDCRYSRNVERNIDIGDATKLLIEAGAGTLEIVGEAGRKDVLIEARLCASKEGFLDKMDVMSEVGRGKAHFETVFPDRSLMSGFNHNMSIDLVMKVPATATLDVADSSGKASVMKVANLVMTDSSGALKIENIRGDLSVVDSSGEMILRNIGGDVEITDSSGAISVTDVKGSVLVIADSSGEIEAKRIGKNVTIKRDSSGSIEVKDVGGDFVVLRDGSGGIQYKNVTGRVELPR